MNKYPVEEDYIIEEETIYCEDFREQMLENDEISAWEEGFMSGWNRAWDEVEI